MKKYNNKIKDNAGLTIIELMISIAVGSIVLMMLMQMLVMNITVRRKYEYENFVTGQSLLITDHIRKNLNVLQPHRADLITNNATETVITFTHEFDITVDGVGVLIPSYNTDPPDELVYDKLAGTLTYNGQLLHSSNIYIVPGSTITLEYYENVDPDPNTCDDYYNERICGDGVITMTLTIAVVVDGNILDEYTFVTSIIV